MTTSIFLTTPAGMFSDIQQAYRCARALIAKINYFCNQKNIVNTKVSVGVSNVNPRIAQYTVSRGKVGKPQRILKGDLETCFVNPHLHILIDGPRKELLSQIIMVYFMKRFDSAKKPNKKVRIWKKYISIYDITRVQKYINKQSCHILCSNFHRNKNVKTIKINVKKSNNNDANKRNILLCNLRSQWYTVQMLKNIATYIVDDYLFNDLMSLQYQIERYADILRSNQKLTYSLKEELNKIVLHLDKMRRTTIYLKQRFDEFESRPTPEFYENN